MIKGIIFDFGGTLDNGGNHWAATFCDIYISLGLPVDEFPAAWIYAERNMEGRFTTTPFPTRLEILFRIKALLLLQYLGLDEKYASIIASKACQHAIEEARKSAAVLDILSKKYPLALVSNYYGNLADVVAELGLSQYFKAVIDSGVVGVRKPDSAIFKLGIEALGLDAREILVVGDSYANDIAPARVLGCETLLLRGRPWLLSTAPEPDTPSINSLEELLALY